MAQDKRRPSRLLFQWNQSVTVKLGDGIIVDWRANSINKSKLFFILETSVTERVVLDLLTHFL